MELEVEENDLKAAGTEIFIGGGQRGIHIHDWLLSLFHESRIYEYKFAVVKKKRHLKNTNIIIFQHHHHGTTQNPRNNNKGNLAIKKKSGSGIWV
ncbi:hypothetical protein P8452_17033 [Trifolium repens]|nr:hypothetical protein P8452_17033 [Trifolium repens]